MPQMPVSVLLGRCSNYPVVAKTQPNPHDPAFDVVEKLLATNACNRSRSTLCSMSFSIAIHPSLAVSRRWRHDARATVASVDKPGAPVQPKKETR